MKRKLTSGIRRRQRRLPLAQVSTHRLERHPKDGWTLADPYPFGSGARRAFRGIIRALCPPAPAPADPALLEKVELGARRFIRYMHPVVARGLWLSLFVLDWLPVLMLKSPSRLHRLPPDRARAVLRRLTRSRLRAFRMVILGVRGVVLSVYFDQDEVHRALGYSPSDHIRSRIELRHRLLREPVAAKE